MPHDDLGFLVRAVGKRHDDVIVDLGQRRAVAVELVPALAVGIEHALVDVGCVVLQPGEQASVRN